MNYSLNAFDQYQQLENRLTRALGVTLERSPAFRKAFIRKFAGNARIGANADIRLQLAEGKRRDLEEQSGIPDLTLIDDKDNAIIIESKVNARLVLSQLEAHERRAARNDFRILKGLAITGRDRDGKTLAAWKRRGGKSKADWNHVTWRSVYELARAQPLENAWAREFADYMEIFAVEMDEKGMGRDVRVMGFSGIPFNSHEDYDIKIAKRMLRALVDDLMEDRKFLSALGFKKGQTPLNRKKIKNELAVWDYLAPPGGDSHTRNHHFTVALYDNQARAALTIPNNMFRRLRAYIKKSDDGEFHELMRQILAGLEKSGVIKDGGEPYVSIVQRRYKTRTEIYAHDGRLEFDIRTMLGQKRKGQEPAIREQPAWVGFAEQLILDKSGNTQFQVGVRFPYKRCKKIRTSEFSGLVKKAFVAMTPVVGRVSG